MFTPLPLSREIPTHARRVAHYGHVAGRYHAPFLRTYEGAIWTVVTNGHALLAMRTRATRRLSGPGPIGAAVRLGKRRRACYASLDDLRAFLKEDTTRPCVDVAGATVDPALVLRFIAPFKGGEVALRTDVTGRALRIEGDGWFVVVMERIGSARAKFNAVRMNRARAAPATVPDNPIPSPGCAMSLATCAYGEE